MAQNISLLGANYTGVPAVELPKTGGGTATFVDEAEIVTVYKGTSAPPASLGSVGDLYAQK